MADIVHCLKRDVSETQESWLRNHSEALFNLAAATLETLERVSTLWIML